MIFRLLETVVENSYQITEVDLAIAGLRAARGHDRCVDTERAAAASAAPSTASILTTPSAAVVSATAAARVGIRTAAAESAGSRVTDIGSTVTTVDQGVSSGRT